MALVAIGCKLPNGLSIPSADGKSRLKINGTNTAMIVGGHGITHIEEAEADVFFATHADYEPVKNGMIFRHNSSNDVADINAIAKEREEQKSGFEELDPSKPGAGLKAADGQALKSAEVGKPKGRNHNKAAT